MNTQAGVSVAATVVDAAERERLRRETRRLLVGWAGAVVVVLGGALAWVLLARPDNANWLWLQMFTLATVPGKYVIFSGVSAASPLGPWGLCVAAIGVDAIVALTLAVGLAPLGRVPGLGPALRNVHDRAQTALSEYPRLKRMAFWGVTIFVFLPLPASGSVGGTFAGQLLGLTRTMGLAAVLLGGALVSVTFAALAGALGSQAAAILDNPWISVVSGVVFLLVVLLAWNRAKKLLRS